MMRLFAFIIASICVIASTTNGKMITHIGDCAITLYYRGRESDCDALKHGLTENDFDNKIDFSTYIVRTGTITMLELMCTHMKDHMSSRDFVFIDSDMNNTDTFTASCKKSVMSFYYSFNNNNINTSRPTDQEIVSALASNSKERMRID